MRLTTGQLRCCEKGSDKSKDEILQEFKESQICKEVQRELEKSQRVIEVLRKEKTTELVVPKRP